MIVIRENQSDEQLVLATQIGATIRSHRHLRKLTLQKLADLSGLSQPFLSQLENGRHNPSIMTLHKIASILGTNAQALLAENHDGLHSERKPGIHVVKRSTSPTYTLSPGAEIQFLMDGEGNMQPNIVLAHPGSAAGQHTEHAGDEFIYVLSGSVEVQVSDQTETLQQGDFIYYPATTSHSWACAGSIPAHFLIVSSSSSF